MSKSPLRPTPSSSSTSCLPTGSALFLPPPPTPTTPFLGLADSVLEVFSIEVSDAAIPPNLDEPPVKLSESKEDLHFSYWLWGPGRARPALRASSWRLSSLRMNNAQSASGWLGSKKGEWSLMLAAAESGKRMHQCHPNIWRRLWRGHSWPSRLSHKDFYQRLLGRRRTFFQLKSSTRLVVCSRVSSSDANCMSALLKVKNHANVSQQKVFWKNQTFPTLSGSVCGFGRTGFSLHRSVRESLVWKSPQAHLGRHTRRSGVGFCKAKCQRCEVWKRSNWASSNGLADPLGLEL